MKKLKRFRQVLKERELESLPYLDEVFISEDGVNYEQYLTETRNWVGGRFKRNIGIDQPTSGVGQRHAHVLGRKGEEIVIVNADGTGSHGTKGKLHPDDAEALRKRDFNIPDDNVIEWNVVDAAELLLG